MEKHYLVRSNSSSDTLLDLGAAYDKFEDYCNAFEYVELVEVRNGKEVILEQSW